MSTDRTRLQSGQSLVEMMVVVLVLGLVLATVTAAFLSVQRTSDEIDNRFENTGEAQKLIAALTKDVRTATPLTAGTSPFLTGPGEGGADKRRMTFYGDLNFVTGATPRFPNKIDLLIDTTNPAAPVLKEFIWVPTNNNTLDAAPNYNATATSLRLVGQYVANAAIDPIFKYYDGSNPPVELIPQTSPAVGLSLADQLKVRTVKIALSVRKQTSRAVQPVRVESTVRLSNVIYGNLTAS